MKLISSYLMFVIMIVFLFGFAYSFSGQNYNPECVCVCCEDHSTDCCKSGECMTGSENGECTHASKENTVKKECCKKGEIDKVSETKSDKCKKNGNCCKAK